MSFDESKHPRDNDGKFATSGKNGANSKARAVATKMAIRNAEQKSIKQQVSSAKELLNKTESIGITADYESPIQEKIRQVKYQLSKTNGVVSRADIGDIQVGDKIKKGLAYLKTNAERSAIMAIPQVIEKGIIIHKAPDHKGRGYSTITIANKVYFDNQYNGVMAVVIKQSLGNAYKVHRVLTPDGRNLEV